MANMERLIHHNSATNKHIHEVPQAGEEEDFQIFGTQPQPPLLPPPKVFGLCVQRRLPCDPATLPGHSQVGVAELHLSHNQIPVPALCLARELEATKQLPPQVQEPWAPGIVFERGCKVGAAEEAVLLLASTLPASRLMVIRAGI